ncbi:MAG: hypothetical protein M1817_003098 [Caeruleum heppii]|nr:MAG: hypothetical protein M1817_003098 [Caeruleum heppii]
MRPPVFGQTVAVMDRSGKVISTSKTLLSVFKEAKAAYTDRKAEITAGRHTVRQVKHDRRLQASLGSGPEHRTRSKKRQKPKSDHIGTCGAHGDQESKVSFTSTKSSSPSTSIDSTVPPRPRGHLSRRHTTQQDSQVSLRRQTLRSNTMPGPPVDMDLAYGEVPPPLPMGPPIADEELRGLMLKASAIMDEIECVQHSVSTIIASLQRNPDALAAVALTLAEISNVAAKLAPGALTAMKGTFPAVVALLASPQFLIAAGVGVGVLVVALGGYKVIKKIQARNTDEGMLGLQEITTDVNRIEMWRQGIEPTDDGASIDTSVEAEFITPGALAIQRVAELERQQEVMKHEQSKPTVSKRSKRLTELTRAKSKKSSALRLLFR